MIREDVAYVRREIVVVQVLMTGGFIALLWLTTKALEIAVFSEGAVFSIYAAALAVSTLGLLLWKDSLIRRNGGYIRYAQDALKTGADEKDILTWEAYKERLPKAMLGVAIALTLAAPLTALVICLYQLF